MEVAGYIFWVGGGDWTLLGGDGWRYIFSEWGSVDIYYGRVGVGGGIL